MVILSAKPKPKKIKIFKSNKKLNYKCKKAIYTGSSTSDEGAIDNWEYKTTFKININFAYELSIEAEFAANKAVENDPGILCAKLLEER